MLRDDDDKLQPAPAWLFDRRPLVCPCAARRPGGGWELTAFVLGGPEQKSHRHDAFVLTRTEAPTLTITSDAGNAVAVAGGDRSGWSGSLCVEGEGDTEEEARARLDQRSLSVMGSTVAIVSPNLFGLHVSARLLVEGPRDAGVVIHASYASVDVRDMAGPVRIAAAHARASILDTTGQLDAHAMSVDFAGASGRVTLSADGEINMKMTKPQFTGTLMAWASEAVRVLMPQGFTTRFSVTVNRREDFVCRTTPPSRITEARQGSLYLFSSGADDGDGSSLRLRSERGPVILDAIDHDRW